MSELYASFSDVVWTPISPGVDRGELYGCRPGAGSALLRFEMGARASDHIHPGGEWLFLHSGKLRVGTHVLRPGDFLFTPAGGINDAEAIQDSIVFQMQPEAMQFIDAEGSEVGTTELT